MNIFKAIANEFEDTALNIKNIFAPNQKPEAEGKVLSDGSISHDIDLSEFTGPDRAEAEKLIAGTLHAIDDFETRAADAREAGDTELAVHYNQKANEAKQAFTQLKWELEVEDMDMVGVSAGIMLTPIGGILFNALREPNIADRIEDAQAAVGHYQMEEFIEMESADSVGGTGDTHGTDGADGSATSAESGGDIMGKSPAELAAWLETDPQGFFAALKEVGSEDRGPLLMLVQGEIQQNNQLFSMLSNFQSAMHDTTKAMVSNLRV